MAVAGKIAEYAQGELPETWRALAQASSYGESFLERKVQSVMTSLFGESLSADLQNTLDERVADFAGKLVALEIITPGIDYWGKQPLSIGATGRNENKGYNDRAQHLRVLRADLIERTRAMWPEVEALLPRRRVKRVANIPRVAQATGVLVPSPFEFERPYAPGTGGTP